MLLVLERGISGRIYHAIQRYGRTNNKIMEKYDKKGPSYLNYCDVINL